VCAVKLRTDPGSVFLIYPLDCDERSTVIVDHMTFIIEAVKDNHHTFDIRSSAVVAVVLALKLVADGFEVTIGTPSGELYGADRFNLLLTDTNSDCQGKAGDG
jgi:hypothetical protein